MIPVFILVTDHGDDAKRMVNANEILSVNKDEDDEYSYLNYVREDLESIEINETPEEVHNLIQDQLKRG